MNNFAFSDREQKKKFKFSCNSPVTFWRQSRGKYVLWHKFPFESKLQSPLKFSSKSSKWCLYIGHQINRKVQCIFTNSSDRRIFDIRKISITINGQFNEVLLRLKLVYLYNLKIPNPCLSIQIKTKFWIHCWVMCRLKCRLVLVMQIVIFIPSAFRHEIENNKSR